MPGIDWGGGGMPQFSDYLPSGQSALGAPSRLTPQADIPATGTGDWFTSALGAGWHGMLSEGARAAQAGAQLAGATDTAQSLSDFAQAHHAAEQSYARPDLEDSWSPTAIAYKVARMIPQGLAIAGGTLIGAATAPEAAAGAGAAAIAAAARVAATRGTIGAAATLFPSAVGGNVQRQISETGELTSPGTALALGVPEAAVQAWLPGHLEQYFGRGILRGIAHSAAAQGFAGGATEFMTQQMGDPDRSLADRASAIVSQTLAGGALGGIVGGAFGGIRALAGKPANNVTTKNLDDVTKQGLGLEPPPGSEAAPGVVPLPGGEVPPPVAPPPVWPPGPATAADVRANMAPPSVAPPPAWPPASPVVRAAAPSELVPPAVWPPGEVPAVPPAPSIVPPAAWPPGGAPAMPPAEPVAPAAAPAVPAVPVAPAASAAAASVVPAPEMPRGEPAAPVLAPGEPVVGAPAPGEPPPTVAPAAAVPVPVLNFTARLTERALKEGMAQVAAAPVEAQAVVRQQLIDTIIARGDKKLTKGLEQWGKAFDILTPEGELREEFIPEQPPELPPGVTSEPPEALGAAAPADADAIAALRETIKRLRTPEEAEEARKKGITDETIDAAIKQMFETQAAESAAPAAPAAPVTLFHGSLSDGITELNPGTHVGTHVAAADRIDRLMDLPNERRPVGVPAEGNENPVVYRVPVPHNPVELPEHRWDQPEIVAKALLDTNKITDAEYREILKTGNYIDVLKRKGYDAIAYENEKEDPGSTSYMLLQKTPVERVGSYDPRTRTVAEPTVAAPMPTAEAPSPAGLPTDHLTALRQNQRDNAAFDRAVAALRADKSVNREGMRAIAKDYLGYELPKAKGRGDALQEIIERQRIEARQIARGAVLDRSLTWVTRAEPAPPVSDVPIKTADDRAAVFNGVQAQIAKLSDPEAQAQHTAEAETIAKLLPLAEGNPGLVPKLNDRLDNLRAAVEAAAQRPADQVTSPDLAPSPRAEATPAPTGDLDARVKAAQDALYALRTKARGGLGTHPDAGSVLDAHQQWLADIAKATGPDELRVALAKNPELDPDGDNLGNLTQISKPMSAKINAYLSVQEKVLQELRAQTGSYAKVITSRDGLPVTQLDADVTDHAQRGVLAVDAADHLIEHTADPEEAALVAKLRAALPEDVKLVFRDGVTDKEGEYFPKQKIIALYNVANATATFIHEMAHAVMHKAIDGASDAAKAVRDIYDQLKSKGDHAGITDAHEMVSEAFANPVYRDFLKSQFVRGTSLWDRFVDTMRGFIGLDPRLYNAFDRVMSYGDDLMKEQQQYPNDWVGRDSYASVANRGTEAAANGADQARETLFQQVKDWRDGKGLNMRDAIRRGALAGLDGYRLGELWGHVVESMRPFVAVLSKEDTRKGTLLKGSQKGQDLANTLTDEGRTLLNKALTATFNGIDPRKPATIEVSENPALSAVHQDLAGAYKRLISMSNGEAAYEALRANMSTYHNIGLLDKLQALERGLSGYTAPDRMNTFDQRIDLHTDPVKTERFSIDAVKNASDSLTAHREQLADQQATVDKQIKAGGVSTDDMKKLVEQSSGLKSDIASINSILKDVASQRDAAAKSPYFHIGRHGNYFVTAKLALDPDGGAVDQGKLAKFIEHLDNSGFADIAPMRGGEHDTFYARVKNVSEMSQLEQAVRDAQKQGLLSPDKGSIGSGEATRVFGSIASDSMRKAIEAMKANRPEVPEGVDPDAFNKAFGKQIGDMQRTLLDMTSENSASRLLAQRKNVQGFDQDMIKSQRDAAMTMSSHLARMTTAWEKGELMANMRDEVRDLNHSDADANTKVGASQAVGEFMLRDALRSAYVPSNWIDAARHITHTWAVGSSPAYFLMLMSQVATTALPELYKTHGIAAVPALLKAMPRTMKIISAMARSPDRFNADITYDILKAAGIDQSTIDETMGNVARGKLVPAYSVAQTERSLPTGGVTRTAVQAADALGKYAELIPRLIVSYAARDLYNKSGGYEHPLLGKMTADQFVDRNIVESQGEWAGNLAPRYTSARGGFFGAATPMIDQFMGWQLRMSGKLYQEVQNMFDERTRPEATRWLIGHGAATTMLAGTLGLPLLSVAASVYDRLMDWVTNRDDHDLTASYRGFLSDTFGKDMGEIIARGLPRAAGMDFEHWGESTIFPGSSAINILFEKRKFEDAERDWAKSMAGAGIGEMANAYLAARDVFNGDYLNGLIKIAPEIIKAPAEAYRLHERGFVNNLTGQKLPISGPNTFDIMMTALGIDPAKQAEYQEVTREETGLRTMRQLNSANIVRHLEQAYMRGDRGMLDTWMGEAQKWQVDHPGLMPPQADFQRELETHIRASAQAAGMGLPIGVTPRDVGARGALRYGNFPVQ